MIPDPSPIVWACVEDGFYVGNQGGEFIGYIDTLSDGHHVFDRRAQHLGAFPELAEAMARLSPRSVSRPSAPSGVAG